MKIIVEKEKEKIVKNILKELDFNFTQECTNNFIFTDKEEFEESKKILKDEGILLLK